MDRKRGSAITVPVVFCLIFSMFTPVLAADYTRTSVKTGDYAEYSVKMLPSIGNYTKVRIDVTGVSGTVVSLDEHWYLNNGSVVAKHRAVNITSGHMYEYPNLWIVTPGLSEGDSAFNPPGGYVINRVSDWEDRTCVWFEMWLRANIWAYFWWDRDTGLLIEYQLIDDYGVYVRYVTFTELVRYELVSTSVFLGFFALLLIGIAVVSGVAVLVVIVRRVSRKHR